MTVRLVTDSNAMLPAALLARYAITAVPMTVVVDGTAHHEDELDPVEFCGLLRAGASVSTSAPSPGELLAAYEALAAEGATAILSIHLGSNQSATVGAAQLVAGQVDVPVTVVDTGTASFIEGCCVWRAAERLADGASIDDATAAARQVAATAASVFTIGEIARVNEGGRLLVAEGGGGAGIRAHGDPVGGEGSAHDGRRLGLLLRQHPVEGFDEDVAAWGPTHIQLIGGASLSTLTCWARERHAACHNPAWRASPPGCLSGSNASPSGCGADPSRRTNRWGASARQTGQIRLRGPPMDKEHPHASIFPTLA